MFTAIVTGPARAIARRWLAGQIPSPLMAFADELTEAACAGLRETRGGGPIRPLAARPGRAGVTLELVSEHGSVAARGQTTTELIALEFPAARFDQIRF